MKGSRCRIAVVGASSLLGKELLTVLEERGFPLSGLETVEEEVSEPTRPFADTGKGGQETPGLRAELPGDFDIAFVAVPTERLGGWLERLRNHPENSATPRVVIDLSSGACGTESPDLRVPLLDHRPAADHDRSAAHEPWLVVSPHAGTIMVGALMARLAACFPVRSAVAQLYSPASEIGPRAIDELQAQTVNLLSFQKVPQEVFGGQIAFNLLPRLETAVERSNPLESRIRRQLQAYLGSRVPMPALRLVRVPVFYSIALSLYVETQQRVAPADVVAALDGRPLMIRRGSQKPPSQVEAAGSNEILVDAIEPDAACPEGIWLWAVADNLRLAALNAAQIAETWLERRQPLSPDPEMGSRAGT
jgi:aspartate-semialdehyde dehydrogenase